MSVYRRKEPWKGVTTMAKTKQERVSILAFERKLVPSDGRMYGTSWNDRERRILPLSIENKSVRGTISNRLKGSIASDPLKLNAEIKKANPQTVDVCSLGADQDTLALQFTLKVLPGVQSPSACDSPEFAHLYAKTVDAYIENFGFVELSRRYAANIANGRFLWRNRVGVDGLEVQIRSALQGSEKSWTIDGTQIPIDAFDVSDARVIEIADEIARALSGKDQFALFEVTAYARVGTAQEVYPSQEMILDTGNNRPPKTLFQIDKQAAMHSQKIGNALRTIDTWYPGYQPGASMPIAVEPYGAVTTEGIAYRPPTTKKDFYTLFDHYARGGSLDSPDDEHYVMAVLVRGGVFGEAKE